MHRLAYRASFVVLFVLIGACEERRLPLGPSTGNGGAGGGGAGGSDAGNETVVLPDVAPPVDGPETPIDDPDANPVGDGGFEAAGFCGNAHIESGEVCDDGNSRPGDGCSGVCTVEPNYTCPAVGQPCVSPDRLRRRQDHRQRGLRRRQRRRRRRLLGHVPGRGGLRLQHAGQACEMVPDNTARCGDGLVNAGEGCDDGAMVSRRRLLGHLLAGGRLCLSHPGHAPACATPTAATGGWTPTSSATTRTPSPGDGCTGRCMLEPFSVCPTPGQPCVSTVVCGDCKVTGDEACDDGNTAAGDGCAADCRQVEGGFTCPRGGETGGACTGCPSPRAATPS